MGKKNPKLHAGEKWVNNDFDIYRIEWINGDKVCILFYDPKRTVIVSQEEIWNGKAGVRKMDT